ncbi:MAG: hypothetical protein J0I41_06050 [Filimonas sp.]|nr:hypothetical protein [Filimonas sp.]
MQRFVQLRHYAIFLLIFIAPVGAFFLIVALIVNLNIPILDTIGPFFLSIVMLGWLAWMYSTGVLLHRKLLETGLHMKLSLFKGFLLTPCIYFLGLLMYAVFDKQSGSNQRTPPEELFLFAVGLGCFFCIYCILYSFYFIAKCLKSIQYKRIASFKEYAGLFFLFWVLPVGIWILQPKINKIFSEDEYELGSDIPAQQ